MSGEGRFFTTLGSDQKTHIPGGIESGGAVQFKEGVTTYMTDKDGNAVYSVGDTVPGDVANYAKGALFVDLDVADGTSGLYVNVGTAASADFKLVTNA